MKLYSFWALIYFLNLNTSFAQKDSIKINWGLNDLAIGSVQPDDLFKTYPRNKCEIKAWNSSLRKRIRYKNISFFFDKIDTLFVLESIYIKLNHKKWFLENVSISNQTKVKDILHLLNSVNFSHALKNDGSPEYLYTELSSKSLSFKLNPVTKDSHYSESSYYDEYLLELYKESRLNSIKIESSNYQTIQQLITPTITQDFQLFHSRKGNKTYYKDKDSSLIIEAHSGCALCLHPPYYMAYKYDKKDRIKSSFYFRGYPLVNKKQSPDKTLLVLSKAALRKRVYSYRKKEEVTIACYGRKNTKSLYYLTEIIHDKKEN